MSEITQNRTSKRIGALQISIIVLTVVTGLVHLYRGAMMTFLMGPRVRPAGAPPAGAGHFHGGGPGGPLGIIFTILPILFYLNAIGYFVLAAALYLPALQRIQSLVRWVLVGYTALTVIAWYVITNAQPNILAYIDKPIEIALIVLLIIDAQRSRSSQRGTPATQAG